MSNPNKALWERVCVTDPQAVKPITGKQYKGNSPKPYWIVERLTEEFGPCGKGWGFTIVSERMERLSETDVLHVAVVDFWYRLDGDTCHIQQVGQTKATYWSAPREGQAKLVVDEDAPKKSVTDALVKCASYIGFAGDIFAGRWDDSKYVAWAAEEWKTRNDPEAAKAAARQAELEELALYLVDCHEHGNDLQAIECWYAPETWSAEAEVAEEEKTTVWGLLKASSKLRSAIKANHPDRLKAAADAVAAKAAAEQQAA
jgi:hypothetical protein